MVLIEIFFFFFDEHECLQLRSASICGKLNVTIFDRIGDSFVDTCAPAT